MADKIIDDPRIVDMLMDDYEPDDDDFVDEDVVIDAWLSTLVDTQDDFLDIGDQIDREYQAA